MSKIRRALIHFDSSYQYEIKCKNVRFFNRKGNNRWIEKISSRDDIFRLLLVPVT